MIKKSQKFSISCYIWNS